MKDELEKKEICTECGASDSCKKVDFKEYHEIKEKFGLVDQQHNTQDEVEKILKGLGDFWRLDKTAEETDSGCPSFTRINREIENLFNTQRQQLEKKHREEMEEVRSLYRDGFKEIAKCLRDSYLKKSAQKIEDDLVKLDEIINNINTDEV